MKTFTYSLCLTGVLVSTGAFADHGSVETTQANSLLETVYVSGRKTERNLEDHLSSEAVIHQPVHDAGELLRSINGMSATRRGGRGFDPIIRGQSQNQLNIITDGAYTYGACPGRMDPPTTYTALDNFDEVTVIKGNRSVVHGSGGSGGTLIFRHKRPDLGEKKYEGYVSGSYTGNSDIASAAASLAAGNETAFIRVFGDSKNAHNYRDGDGNHVSSAFETDSVGVITGGDIGDSDYLEFSIESVSERDTWFAGSGMDSPGTDSDTHRFKWERNAPVGFIDSMELNIYSSDVDHLMDNYSVRQRNMMPNGMVAPSSSDTQGGRWIARSEHESSQWQYGVDYRYVKRDAELWMDMGKDGVYDMRINNLWPDIRQGMVGLFAEVDHDLTERDQLRAGVRVDRFESDAKRADDMAMTTANTLYRQFYGEEVKDRSETDVGFVLGWDRQLNEALVLSANLSRTVRYPDANEQYIARRAMGTNWVGNPDIGAEKHHQLDLTLVSRRDSLRWSASAYYDDVDNYIDRYAVGMNTLYRNIDARISGAEFDVGYEFASGWSVSGALSYTDGEDDKGNMPQISPLEARVNVGYNKNNWQVGAELVAADDQSQWDPANDADETPGFGVLNLFGSYTHNNRLLIQGGIENVFDRTYAYHVNRGGGADPFNPQPSQIHEPGRQVWVKFRYQF